MLYVSCIVLFLEHYLFLFLLLFAPLFSFSFSILQSTPGLYDLSVELM